MLDEGPDTVELWPAVETVDPRGNIVRLPSLGPPRVLTSVWVRPAATGYVLVCRVFPAGIFSRIAWGEQDFDINTEPVIVPGGPTRLGHVRVQLTARAPRPANG